MIGVLTTSYPRSPDDPAGHFVRGFCDWLARHVAPVEVLALDAPADPARRLAQGGLPTQLRGARGALRAAAITVRLSVAARRRCDRWDAIVSHWLLPCGLVGDRVAGGRRHLAIAHGSDVALLRRLPGGAALAARLARRADLVYVADALQLPGAPGRVLTMPPAARWPRPTSEQRCLARAVLGLDPPGHGPLVLLFVGRMIADKGVDLLLESIPEGAIALLVGDGPARPAAIGPRARWLGARFGADLQTCFAAADVLVVPSRRDGSPTVIGEARAAGLPVLGARVGGIPAAIGGDGQAVEHGAMRRTIAAWVADRSLVPEVVGEPTNWSELGPKLWGSHDSPRQFLSDCDLKTSFY